MTPAARLSAAIEALAAIDTQRIPAANALKEWGRAHRFAGSSDRAAIAGLVYDVLRRRASSAFMMGDESPRARLLGMLRLERGLDVEAIARLCDGGRFAPPPLTETERAALAERSPDAAPPPVAGDYPDWLDEELASAFGEARATEAAALARRAPLDLRVNTIKADRQAVLGALAHLGARPTPWSPWGIRIALDADARSPGIQAEPEFIKGAVEVQDEGSQLVALMSGASPGETVIDLCAGGGGKTLALAAMMGNRGRLIATDDDKRRLAPIHDRLIRAGARLPEVFTPKGAADPLASFGASADMVLVDAPCTGTGTWRRNPDAKWRMRPGALDERLKDQVEVLDRASLLVRPGGRLVYVTCSVLPSENGAQVRAFRDRHAGFSLLAPEAVAAGLGPRAAAFRQAAALTDEGILMTPLRTGTDGFFIAVLRRDQAAA
ncbi:MAG: RsmB/NOP family class I SAM-dependent RNA methyltransferase [Xanthobacteraceae bacterium]|nr:MAG: RsmB/NOP family class I SAM-dependent RNA methyltransferase [Xanthobacteraceae bacterium]